MGMGLPDNRRKADSSYRSKALWGLVVVGVLLKGLLLPNLLLAAFRFKLRRAR